MKYLKYFENNINFDFSHKSEFISSLSEFNINIPKKVNGYFKCNSNNLTTLKYCPESIIGNFDCSNNKLTSLEFCPKNIDDDFYCSYNKLTSLEFCPKHVGRDFYCSNNNLTSLDFLPKTFNGNLLCSDNNWTNPIPFELIKKHNIDTFRLYTSDLKEKFGSYEYQKGYLTNTPENYKDLEPIGYNDKIKEEFDWLFNAVDMGLM